MTFAIAWRRSVLCKDLPDHIAIELEFLGFLVYKEIEALENSDPHAADEYRAKQEAFAEAVLHPWVPDFCETIGQGTDNEFYLALAECLSVVIGGDGRRGDEVQHEHAGNREVAAEKGGAGREVTSEQRVAS